MSALTGLSLRQLETLEQVYDLRGKKPVLDIGCHDVAWVLKLRGCGTNALGVDDPTAVPATTAPQEGILRLSVAANLAVPVHACDVALIRGTAVFLAEGIAPECTIALANVLSTIKPHGHLVCAVPTDNVQAVQLWQQRLAPFGLTGTIRNLGAGLLSWLTLAPLLRPGGAVNVLEFQLSPKAISRLEWHRLAREAVMSQRASSPAAA